MPTFCRHNRFIERCPICSKTLPGNEPAGGSPRRAGTAGAKRAGTSPGRGATGLKVRREGRAAEDGYSNELVPGLRASADAIRLAAEIDFAAMRLAALALDPPGLYGELRGLAATDTEHATWGALISAYLAPTEDPDPFASIRAVLAEVPGPASLDGDIDALLDEADTGPRSSREPGRARGRCWPMRSGSAVPAGEARRWPSRATAPGLRSGVSPGSSNDLHCPASTVRDAMNFSSHWAAWGSTSCRPTRCSSEARARTRRRSAAKRVFGIGDPLLLERRAGALAAAAEVPLEALDLALANWAAPERATAGFPASGGEGAPATEAAGALGV